ncbi:MAG: hypothetical protein U9O56_06555 [Campylobacterota bacterium]|nr:hypothetical protein [Campylobacterota bacterium]
MFKAYILYFFITLSLLSGSELQNKIENIITTKNYQIHKHLIEHLFKNESEFIVNKNFKYYKIFKLLREHGLLDLKLNHPSDITLEFETIAKNKKAFKILNDTIKSIGYRYFFTKSFKIDENKNILWSIKFKAEYITDPVVLIKDLEYKNCKIINVENRGDNNWFYKIDFENSILKEAYKIQSNEKVKFQKPLQEYFILVDDVSSLQVISRNLNNWYPYIVFFDSSMEYIDSIKKNRVYKGLKVKIPNNTKYIKISDSFNLINIKRGLTVIVR